ncbi:MAG: hypothetical protein ACM3ZC_02000 [Bacteroidota bacterium]
MAFFCPYCRKAQLTAVGRFHCSSRARGVDVLQLMFCDHCGLHVLGLGGESSAGAMPEQLGYIVEKRFWTEMHLIWACCPDPHNPDCDCQAHQRLSRLSLGDRPGIPLLAAGA